MNLFLFIFIIFINKIYLHSTEFELSDEELGQVSKKVSSILMYQYYLETSLNDVFLYMESKKSKDLYLDYFKQINECIESETDNQSYKITSFYSFNNNFVIYNVFPNYGRQNIVGFLDNSFRFLLKRNGRLYFLKNFNNSSFKTNSYKEIKNIIDSEDLFLNAYYYLLFNLNIKYLVELEETNIISKYKIDRNKNSIQNTKEKITNEIKFITNNFEILVFFNDNEFSHQINSVSK